ncbi:aldo/keto reductase [Phytomonospora endophytica]|uniref:Aryl-alcohol dehydrogenase-like predicted oxidoreductase n=1 Tax=Phytomonospora endophytica TaxID=714109 RepID=A0A841FPI9_9ACTN|nr:aldo/keto reductase [Phytomonospora endophytica]MBB6033870.1 aryl-alcohol dehydrogenase-like predicted oxidoreductase [Phytomonospora endophytica]GIG64611.1 aldo/keto reductase [Phytomonospora endophytica]
MEQRYLGRSGLKVSELAMGSAFFGGKVAETDAHALLDAFTTDGGTFVDTADAYGAGAAEEVVGRWLKGRRRDDLVIATKVYGRTGEAPNDAGLGRKHILSAVEASLKRLNTDHIDVYYTHVFDDATPLEETLSALDGLVKSGKVRYLGASNLSGWQLQKSVDLADRHGLERYVALQPLYNLLDRETEWELVEVARNEGIGVVPWAPLREGWLTGRYQRGDGPADGTRLAENAGAWDDYANEHTWSVLDVLGEVAEEAGRTIAQVALRWLIQADTVTAPIIGPSSMTQYRDCAGAAGWELSPEQFTRLSQASDKPKIYPYNVLAANRRR